jgi:glutamyl-tRNA synthetase
MKTIENQVRTRFAPSPTGYLHVGGLRTALYAYLFAKKSGGSFLLRIEDTDQARTIQGAVENIITTLEWAGMTYDEGPNKPGVCSTYIQSERLPLYKKHAEQLVEQGDAYYCFCTPERLDQMRAQQQAAHLPPCYDRHCRSLPKDEVATRLAVGERHVIRMKVPLEGEMTFPDQIRGDITIQYKVIDDQVLMKSDGFPTYHLAVVVDDHDMKITHVIRGEEWLPSTPKHLLLYQYFKWTPPMFAHLPLLLNPDRSKLSKRQGDVAVEDYRAKGYLPEALVNFVALLGWNPGTTQEIFSLQELIKEFSLERVGKAGAVFDIEKLKWLNQQYIMKSSTDHLLTYVKPLLAQKAWGTFTDEYVKKVIDLMKDRAVLLPDFVDLTSFFFVAPITFDEKSMAKCWNPEAVKNLQILAERYAAIETFDAASTEQSLRALAAELNTTASKLVLPLRLAVTGVSQGPSLFHFLEVIGKQESLDRVAYACKTLS